MARPPGILTLTTDFGTEGPYVASIKGVVLGLAPGTQFVDVTHKVTPQNVLEGAFVMAEIVESFPAGTVHLGVVDPGVGTDRRLLAARVRDQWFVLPDNGLITGVVRRDEPTGLWEIDNPRLRRPRVSSTFHGRDILAPAAAFLLEGGDPDQLGPRRDSFARLRNFHPSADEHGLLGEILFRDAFGNLVSNISGDDLAGTPAERWSVEIAGQRIDGLARTYAERPSGSLVALEGSSGWIEVAVVNGDAARYLAVGPGTTIRARRRA